MRMVFSWKVVFLNPTRFSFENQWVSGNPKYLVISDILGIPDIMCKPKHWVCPKYLEIPDISTYTREIPDWIFQHSYATWTRPLPNFFSNTRPCLWAADQYWIAGGVRFGVLPRSHFGDQLGLDNGNGNGNNNGTGNGNGNWPLRFKIHDKSNAGPQLTSTVIKSLVSNVEPQLTSSLKKMWRQWRMAQTDLYG